MEHLLKEIAERRKAAEYDAAEIETLQAELEKTPEYQRLKLAKNSYKDFTADTETKITEAKEAALKDYKLTHKDPIAGFILRDKTVYTYTREAAETWAKENASFLFVFDEKAFKELAKGKNKPPCVAVDKVPEIQLASDLSMYLVELPGETAGNPIKQEPIFSEGPAA